MREDYDKQIYAKTISDNELDRNAPELNTQIGFADVIGFHEL